MGFRLDVTGTNKIGKTWTAGADCDSRAAVEKAKDHFAELNARTTKSERLDFTVTKK